MKQKQFTAFREGGAVEREQGDGLRLPGSGDPQTIAVQSAGSAKGFRFRGDDAKSIGFWIQLEFARFTAYRLPVADCAEKFLFFRPQRLLPAGAKVNGAYRRRKRFPRRENSDAGAEPEK